MAGIYTAHQPLACTCTMSRSSSPESPVFFTAKSYSCSRGQKSSTANGKNLTLESRPLKLEKMSWRRQCTILKPRRERFTKEMGEREGWQDEKLRRIDRDVQQIKRRLNAWDRAEEKLRRQRRDRLEKGGKGWKGMQRLERNAKDWRLKKGRESKFAKSCKRTAKEK